MIFDFSNSLEMHVVVKILYYAITILCGEVSGQSMKLTPSFSSGILKCIEISFHIAGVSYLMA